MVEERISVRLRMILHSLATKVPKIVLYRVERLFPALRTSMVSVLYFMLITLCFTFLVKYSCKEVKLLLSISDAELSKVCYWFLIILLLHE
jgi:cellobiose-specific phosphotransferase system component IIC